MTSLKAMGTYWKKKMRKTLSRCAVAERVAKQLLGVEIAMSTCVITVYEPTKEYGLQEITSF